jgi:hypothetical protein
MFRLRRPYIFVKGKYKNKSAALNGSLKISLLFALQGTLPQLLSGVSCTVHWGIGRFWHVCSWSPGAVGPTSSESAL